MEERGIPIIIGIILSLIVIGVTATAIYLSATQEPVVLTEEQICAQANATWKEFSNGCADNCLGSEVRFCTQALTMGCDCGNSKCWNGNSCVAG